MIDEGDIPSIQCKMNLRLPPMAHRVLVFNLGTDRIENNASNNVPNFNGGRCLAVGRILSRFYPAVAATAVSVKI
jgi:hypothetical protein